ADGYGWVVILADFGDSATVLFAGTGTGTDIELLDLGSSVCPTRVGMPADVAARLAPNDSWIGECAAVPTPG
ncbi:MAG TPA: hypothetical protein VGO78_29755, partial [Acidimicrobiales bacterium]|nr:hypothetical protein [Acidimicrobiales bacterium]